MADYITAQHLAEFAQEFDALGPSGQTLIATAASRLFDSLVEVDADFFAVASGWAYSKILFGDGSAYLKIPPHVGTATVTGIVDKNDSVLEIPAYYEENGFLTIRDYHSGVPIRDVANAVPVYYSQWVNRDPTFSTYNKPFGGWYDGQRITVSADWGFASVPSDILMAVIQLAIHVWRNTDPAFKAISAANAPDTYPPMVLDTVKRYRDHYGRRFLFA